MTSTDQIEQLLQRFHATGRGAGDVEDAARELLGQLREALAENEQLRDLATVNANEAAALRDEVQERAGQLGAALIADATEQANEATLRLINEAARADAAEARLAAVQDLCDRIDQELDGLGIGPDRHRVTHRIRAALDAGAVSDDD